MLFRHPILLFASLIAVIPPQELNAQAKPAFSNFEYHVTDDGNFGLYKPKGWKVGTQKFPNGRMVFVGLKSDGSLKKGGYFKTFIPKYAGWQSWHNDEDSS
jgi:hypothetical protein